MYDHRMGTQYYCLYNVVKYEHYNIIECVSALLKIIINCMNSNVPRLL